MCQQLWRIWDFKCMSFSWMLAEDMESPGSETKDITTHCTESNRSFMFISDLFCHAYPSFLTEWCRGGCMEAVYTVSLHHSWEILNLRNSMIMGCTLIYSTFALRWKHYCYYTRSFSHLLFTLFVSEEVFFF